MAVAVTGVVVAGGVLIWPGIHQSADAVSVAASASASAKAAATQSASADTSASATASATPSPTEGTATLPGVGRTMTAEVPSDSTQAVVAYGSGVNAYTTEIVLYQKTDGRWIELASWNGHNGRDGWVKVKYAGDLRSPIGVYTLTDAGGRYADPGTSLPYYHSSEFVDYGTGFNGESLINAFDYVIAINYNRVAGTSPLSGDYPLGEDRGGGVWLHVDHGGPTHACVSVPMSGMVYLLRTLKPADHPVIVMGDRADLES